MNNKGLKSQLNSGNFFAFLILYGIFFLFAWDFSDHTIYKTILVCSSIFLIYFALARWVNQFVFYENEIKVIYFFRTHSRIKTYNYDSIQLVKYIVSEGAKAPAIVIIFKGERFTKVFKPSNSLTHFSFNRRKQILLLLKNNGVPIEIQSVIEKDKNILQ